MSHIIILLRVPRTEKSLIASSHLEQLLTSLRVQPVPAPPSIRLEKINNNKLGGNNQKDMLFSRGNRIYIFTAKLISTEPRLNKYMF